MNNLKGISRPRNSTSIAKRKAHAAANAEHLISVHDNLMHTRPSYLKARNTMITQLNSILNH
ncbi:hypothetical protein CXF85_19810 [Colwellia sp. 75C3]|nr:hypothetical protein CXF85_19810 [Colwellia sp. 75C3]